MPLELKSLFPDNNKEINLAVLFPDIKNLLAVSKETLGVALLKELYEYDQRQRGGVLLSIGLIKYNSAID